MDAETIATSSMGNMASSFRRGDVVVAEGSRVEGSVITASLEAVWSDVGVRLRRYAMSRGASAAEADDIAQEVALRALQRDVSFTSSEDVLPWCICVARNLIVDNARRHAREVPTAEVPDQRSTEDVPRQVFAKLEMRRTVQAVKGLSEADQASIRRIFAHDIGRDRRTAVRENVRRLRARERLCKAMLGIAAVFGYCWRRVAGRRGFITVAAMPVVVLAALTGPLGLIAPVVWPPAKTPQPVQLTVHDPPAGLARSGPNEGARRSAGHRAALSGPPATASHANAGMTLAAPSGDRVFIRPAERPPDHPNAIICVGGIPTLEEPACVDRPGSMPAANGPK
jgi:RNA polymerase sigma factor (sigma-70 family)